MTARRWDVLCYGDPCVDQLVAVQALPAAGGKVLGAAHGMLAGGTTANVACALARLGRRSAAFGRTGDDAHGALLRASFEQFGVDTALLRTLAGPSASAILLALPDGEKSVIYQPAAGSAFDTQALAPALAQASVVYAMPYDADEFARLAALARFAGTRIAIDLEAAVAPDALAMAQRAALADIVFFNESGFAAGVGVPPSRDALRAVLALGPQVVVVTLGERGAVAATAQGFAYCASFPATLVDSAGAGDSFNAAFLDAWLHGAALADALRWGCAAASRTVSAVGARTALPDRATVAAVLDNRSIPADNPGGTR